jgi:hypothetical protein
MATVVLSSQGDITPRADGTEIVDLRWFAFPEAEERIRTTNHREKGDLLLQALTLCRQDLVGGASPAERAALADGA